MVESRKDITFTFTTVNDLVECGAGFWVHGQSTKYWAGYGVWESQQQVIYQNIENSLVVLLSIICHKKKNVLCLVKCANRGLGLDVNQALNLCLRCLSQIRVSPDNHFEAPATPPTLPNPPLPSKCKDEW